MPRKSAKGKIKICKALNLDGSKCYKEFTCNRDRSSDHKFCSEKCRKRDFRLKAKKKTHKEQRALKKQEQARQKANLIEVRIGVNYNDIVSILTQLKREITPIQIPKKKGMLDKRFDGLNGVDLFRRYEDNREYLKDQERQRKLNLKANKSMLLNQANLSASKFLTLIDSQELKLGISDKIRATIKDMKSDIINRYQEVNETAPMGFRFSSLDSFLKNIDISKIDLHNL